MTGQERLLGVCSERRLLRFHPGVPGYWDRQAARRVGNGLEGDTSPSGDGENISEGTGGTG